MNLKNYKNMDTIQLEKYIAELLNSDAIKNEAQRAEMKQLHKELQKLNYIKWLKKELFNK